MSGLHQAREGCARVAEAREGYDRVSAARECYARLAADGVGLCQGSSILERVVQGLHKPRRVLPGF